MLDWRAEVLKPLEKKTLILNRWRTIPTILFGMLGIWTVVWGPAEAASMKINEQQPVSNELAGLDMIIDEPRAGRPGLAMQAHQDSITDIVYSPDGTLVATGSLDGTIGIWDSTDGSLIRTLGGHLDGINSIAFSPDGTLMASGSDDRTARLWNVSDGTLVRELDPIMESRVVKVDFSPDGSLVAIGDNRCVIELRRVPTGILSRTIVPIGCAPGNPGGSVDFWGLEFNEVGSRVITGDGRPCCGGGTLQWYETADYAPPEVLKTGNVIVRDLALSPDGSEIALALVGLSDIWLLDSGTGVLKTVLPDHKFRVNDIEYSPDGTLLASVSNDTGVALWNASDGTLVRMLHEHYLQATALAFSPDGASLASGSADGELFIWDVQEQLQN